MAEEGGPQEEKPQMTYGYWALACVRRWGVGVSGALITAEAEQHLKDERSGPALTQKVRSHTLASLHPTLHQPRACRTKKKNLSRVVRHHHGVSGSGNPLAAEGESVLGKRCCLFNLTLFP